MQWMDDFMGSPLCWTWKQPGLPDAGKTDYLFWFPITFQ
jgi:hypothetical protein